MQNDLIAQRIKLQHLKVAMAVAEWGSMAKAAKHLALSQPVISKVVADFEKVLGVRIFDRGSQGVVPTVYGHAVLRRGVAIFDDLRTSLDEIKFMADPTSGELRVGSTEPLLAGFGLAVIERIWLKYPKIDFRIMEADSATLLNRELPERKIEIALVPVTSSSLPPELDATILFHDHLRVVVGARSRWALRRMSTLAELADEPWCMTPTSVGPLAAWAFPASGLSGPRVAVTTTTTHLLFQLLESGRFIGHFGDSLLHFFANRYALKKLPITLPIEPFAVAIVKLKNRTLGPVAQAFIEAAQEVAEPFSKVKPAGRAKGVSTIERGLTTAKV
jgi:DNA-binding transcriptional LysR family regulator